MAFQQILKNRISKNSWVRISDNTLYIGSGTVRKYGLFEFDYAKLFFDPDERKVGIEFFGSKGNEYEYFKISRRSGIESISMGSMHKVFGMDLDGLLIMDGIGYDAERRFMTLFLDRRVKTSGGGKQAGKPGQEK